MRVDKAVGAVASGALEGGAKAAKRAVVEGDIMTLFNPAHLAGKIFQGAFAGAVQTGYNVYQGASRLDHDLTIEAARMHLADGIFSTSQTNTVERWIDQARDRLDTWRKEHRNDDLTTMIPLPAPVEGEGPQPAIANQSFQKVATATERENDAHNPPQKVMREQAKELHDVLQALAAFTKWPRHLTYTTTSEVLENIENNPALGAKDFIDGLKTCAQGLARNPFTKASDKRVMLAISGPGTGKTTSILTMTQWAGLPCVMLTGEDFNAAMTLPQNKDKAPYEVFTQWVAQAVLVGFKGSVNGVILLDDFHKALEDQSNGVFSRFPDDRKKFFEFLKLMGDAAQDAFIYAPLADGHDLALNMGDVHIIITLNRRPPELSNKGEEALLSRLADLNAGYMSPKDRTDYAVSLCEALQQSIIDMGGVLANTERQAARAAFRAIVAIDLDYFTALNEQLGQRGLCDMLNRYRNHIAARAMLTLERGGRISEATFAFAPDFDLAGIAAGIKDYEKVIDASQALEEKRRKIQRGAQQLREQLGALAPAHARAIERILARAESNPEDTTLLPAAEKRLRDYTHNIPMLTVDEVDTHLDNQFSYLIGSADEASPFDKMATIAQDIHRRVVAASKGLYELLPQNRPIQITWENPHGADPMLYHELAKAIGGVPVKTLDTPEKLIRNTFLEEHALSVRHAPRVLAVRDKSFNLDDYDTAIKGLLVAHREVLYLRSRCSGHYYFLKEAGLAMLSRSQNDAVVNVTDPDKFTRARSVDDFVQRAQPRLRLFESILEDADGVRGRAHASASASTQPLSYAASFVVVKWSQTLEDALGKWADANRLCGSERDPEQIFLTHMHEQLNKPELELDGGRLFDPRAVTLFVEGSGKPTYLRAREGETILPWTIPVLPQAGRRRYAAAFLQENLATLKQRAVDNEKIFGVRHVVDLRATEEDQQALARLMDHDEKVYARSKALNYPLSLDALKDGVRWLAEAIEMRAIAAARKRPLKMKVPIADKRWDEYYAKEVGVLEAIEAEQRKVAERDALRQRWLQDPEAEKPQAKGKSARKRAAKAAATHKPKQPTRLVDEQDTDEESAAKSQTKSKVKSQSKPKPETKAKVEPEPKTKVKAKTQNEKKQPVHEPSAATKTGRKKAKEPERLFHIILPKSPDDSDSQSSGSKQSAADASPEPSDSSASSDTSPEASDTSASSDTSNEASDSSATSDTSEQADLAALGD